MSVIIESTANESLKIFAGVDKPLQRRGDDTTAIELLQLLHRLATQEQLSTPTLDRYLAKEYPAIDLGQHIRKIMREITDCPDGYAPDLGEYTHDEYQELCRNLFPEIMLQYYPEPQNLLDPYRNLFITWNLELGDPIREEIWHGSKNIRVIMRIICDYMDLNIHNWPESLAVWFFKNWNGYLLSQQWPDRTEKLEQELADSNDYSRALELVNLHQSKKIAAFELAHQEKFITITQAAKALLTAEFEKTPNKAEVDAIRKRVDRAMEKLPVQLHCIQGKQNWNYYPTHDLAPYFYGDHSLRTMTEEEISGIMLANSTPKSKIDTDKSRTT